MRKQVIYLTLGRGLGAAFQAGIVLILARMVTIDEFGRLNTVLNIGLVAAAFGDFGVSTLIAKARAIGDHRLVSLCVYFNRVTSAVTATALLVVFAWTATGAYEYLSYPVLAVALALDKNIDCMQGIFIADEDRITPAVSIVLRRLVSCLVFGVMLIVGVAPVISYCLGYLLGGLAGQVHVYLLLRIRGTSVRPLPGAMRETIRTSTPYFLSNFSAQSRMLDTPIVSFFAGASSAGLYSGASKIVAPFGLIPSVVTTVLMPHVAKRDATHAKLMRRKLEVFTFFFLALVALLALASSPLTYLLLGNQFAPAGGALAWSLLAMPFICLSSPLGSILQARGHERLVARNGVLFSALGLALTALGATLSGSSGAAAGITVSFALKCVVLHVYISKNIKSVEVQGT